MSKEPHGPETGLGISERTLQPMLMSQCTLCLMIVYAVLGHTGADSDH